MNKVFALLLLLLVCGAGFSQVLPENKKVNWKLAGIRNSVSTDHKLLIITDLSAVANDNSADDEALAKALKTAADEPVIIYFPNGKYNFTKSIKLPSNTILRGQSTDSTILNFKLEKEENLIQALGSAATSEALITRTVYKDSSAVEVANANIFTEGDFIKIYDNDSELVTSSWAYKNTGQIARISKIEGSKIYLQSPLRRDFHISKSPKMLKLNMAQNIGLENFKLIREDKTSAQTSNISFKFTANSWVKCVESYNCNFAHIELTHATNNEISGNYIHHAFSYGSGGKAYGVAVQYASGENLIQNNIFNNLRHSMLLQAGANGNVFAYNYSINPNWSEGFFPANAAGDIVLHGNYVYANLFEANVVQNIVIDNSHGKNGPNNTFLRNRAELYGIIMNANAGDGQVFIGNEITNAAMFLGNFTLTGDNYEYANNKLGVVSPKSTSEPENSLFLENEPAYYKSTSAWPPIGYPNSLKSFSIQAEAFYKSGIYTPCMFKAPAQDTTEVKDTTIIKDTIVVKDTAIIKDSTVVNDSTSTSINKTDFNKSSVKIYPNPASDKVFIQPLNSALAVKEIVIYNAEGRQVLVSERSNMLDISHLQNGLYILRIRLSDNSVIQQKLLKQLN